VSVACVFMAVSPGLATVQLASTSVAAILFLVPF